MEFILLACLCNNNSKSGEWIEQLWLLRLVVGQWKERTTATTWKRREVETFCRLQKIKKTTTTATTNFYRERIYSMAITVGSPFRSFYSWPTESKPRVSKSNQPAHRNSSFRHWILRNQQSNIIWICRRPNQISPTFTYFFSPISPSFIQSEGLLSYSVNDWPFLSARLAA